MTYTYYTCKKCGEYSGNMTLIKQEKNREDEKLRCSCDIINTWASMKANRELLNEY